MADELAEAWNEAEVDGSTDVDMSGSTVADVQNRGEAYAMLMLVSEHLAKCHSMHGRLFELWCERTQLGTG